MRGGEDTEDNEVLLGQEYLIPHLQCGKAHGYDGIVTLLIRLHCLGEERG